MAGSDDPMALALTALAQKERSVAELESWLRRRGVDEDARDAVLEELIAVGTLDDARFAARFAADKRELAGWGAERIRRALLQRRIAPEDVEAAVGEVDSEVEMQRAVAVLRARGAAVDDDRGRSRAFGLLARRGFDRDLAYEAVRSLAGE